MSQPVTAVLVGAGHRALAYAEYARKRPDSLRIVGVADPQEYRRRQAASRFDLPPESCFESAEDLAAAGKIADAAINGTMDTQHVPTTLPLVRAGYDVLLEKPFAVTIDEVRELRDAVESTGRTVMICHVLRYVPLYAEIRRLVRDGAIGQILNLQLNEHVTYHHMAVGFIHGKWNREVHGVGPLMTKSCHDLDILTWMKSGVAPRTVYSRGSLTCFRPENAPPGAGTHCLLDCPVESECLYSARKLWLDHPHRWGFYVYAGLEEENPDPDLAAKEEYLRRPDTPFSRCAWKCDNDVVDHQTVLVEFEDGATGSFNLVGGTPRARRAIHLLGTEGEIEALDDMTIAIRKADPRPGHEFREKIVDPNVQGDLTGAWGGHGGGDLRLVEDFVNVVRGEEPSISCTHLTDSVNGHLLGFYAERSRHEQRPFTIGE